MTKRLIDFISGTDKQIAWASKLRLSFLQLLIENDFKPEDILLIVDIRPIAVWWIDNRTKLNLKDANIVIRSAKAAKTRHGSIQQAVDAQIAAIDKKIMQAAQYHLDQERADAEWQEESYLADVFDGRERPW